MRKYILAGIAVIAAASISQSQEVTTTALDCNKGAAGNAKKICKIIDKLKGELEGNNSPVKGDEDWSGILGVNIEFGPDFYDYAIIPFVPGTFATEICKKRIKRWISAYPIGLNTFLAFCDEGMTGSPDGGPGVVHLEKATLSAGAFSQIVVGNVSCDAAFVPQSVKSHTTCTGK